MKERCKSFIICYTVLNILFVPIMGVFAMICSSLFQVALLETFFFLWTFVILTKVLLCIVFLQTHKDIGLTWNER